MSVRPPPPHPSEQQEAAFESKLPLERLHDDCRRGHHASVYAAIGENPSLINQEGKMGFTALQWAAQCQLQMRKSLSAHQSVVHKYIVEIQSEACNEWLSM
jgi:hypothetical protein